MHSSLVVRQYSTFIFLFFSFLNTITWHQNPFQGEFSAKEDSKAKRHFEEWQFAVVFEDYLWEPAVAKVQCSLAGFLMGLQSLSMLYLE